MKQFKDYMYHNHRLIHRLAVQTEGQQDYQRLNEACKNIIEFYNLNFCNKKLMLPRLPKSEINFKLMAGIHNSALPLMKHYKLAWKSTRSGGERRDERSAGDYKYADAYGNLHRLIGDINVILDYDYYYEGVIVYE